MTVGWVWVAVSYFGEFGISPSGAIVVLTGIIAEMHYADWCLDWALNRDNDMRVQYQTSYESMGDDVPWAAAGALATEEERLDKPDGISYFRVHRIAPRVKRVLRWILTMHLGLGTVIWAYGDRLPGLQ